MNIKKEERKKRRKKGVGEHRENDELGKVKKYNSNCNEYNLAFSIRISKCGNHMSIYACLQHKMT
jgi:hypothetical protein